MVVVIDRYMVMCKRCVTSDNLIATTLKEKENIISKLIMEMITRKNLIQILVQALLRCLSYVR